MPKGSKIKEVFGAEPRAFTVPREIVAKAQSIGVFAFWQWLSELATMQKMKMLFVASLASSRSSLVALPGILNIPSFQRYKRVTTCCKQTTVCQKDSRWCEVCHGVPRLTSVRRLTFLRLVVYSFHFWWSTRVPLF